jgi:hypothetical protein
MVFPGQVSGGPARIEGFLGQLAAPGYYDAQGTGRQASDKIATVRAVRDGGLGPGGARIGPVAIQKMVPLTDVLRQNYINELLARQDRTAYRMGGEALFAGQTGMSGISAAEENVLRRNSELGYRIGGGNGVSPNFLSRAFSGGGTGKFNPLRGATQGADYVQKAAGAGTGVLGAGMLLPALGITAAGAFAVYSSYNNEKDAVEKATNEFTENLKKANKEQLQQVIDMSHDWKDSLWSTVFRQDLPETLASFQMSMLQSAPARNRLGQLDKLNLMPGFAKRIADNQDTKQQLEDFFNRDEENKQLA